MMEKGRKREGGDDRVMEKGGEEGGRIMHRRKRRGADNVRKREDQERVEEGSGGRGKEIFSSSNPYTDTPSPLPITSHHTLTCRPCILDLGSIIPLPTPHSLCKLLESCLCHVSSGH